MIKKIFSFFLFFILSITAIFAEEIPIQYKQYVFKGVLLSNTDPALIGVENYQSLKNLKYTNNGLTIIPGYSKINTTPLSTYTKIRNGSQLRVDRTISSYTLVQAYDSSGNSRIYQNQTAIPSQGDFETTQLHDDATGAGIGRFSGAPQGIVYANGVETMGWWGNEHSPAAFYVVSAVTETDNDIALNDNGASPDTIVATADSFLAKGFRIGQIIAVSGANTTANDGNYEITDISSDGLTISIVTGSFAGTDAAGASTVTIQAEDHAYFNPIDFSDAASNSLTTTGNLVRLGGGNDDNTLLLIHGDGTDESTTITDDSPSTRSIAVSGDAQLDTAVYKFGTASILFDSTTDNIYSADHADWAYGTGEVTIEEWVNFVSTDRIQVFYSQNDSGSYDSANVYFYNDAIYILVADGSSKLISETASWTPTPGTQYHWALIRGWGGVANDWAFTINGTAIHTFTAGITWPDHNDSMYIGGCATQLALDAGPSRHLIKETATASISTTVSKFGDGALYFDGNSDYFTLLTSADWHICESDSDNWTIGAWIKHSADPTGTQVYLCNYQDASNYWQLDHLDGTGLRFRSVRSGANEIILSGGEISDDSWHWVVLAKKANEYGLYLDGYQTAYVQDSDTETYGGVLYIGTVAGGSLFSGYMCDVIISQSDLYGATPNSTPDDDISASIPTTQPTPDSNTKLLIFGDTKSFDGHQDEIRISDIARWTSTFTAPTRVYIENQRRSYIFSTRPIQAVYIDVQEANTVASTMTFKQWIGSSYADVSNFSDGTDTGTITLAQDGWITFDSTEDTAKQWYFEGILLYAYMMEISDGGADITQATINADFQSLGDNWNGTERTPVAVQMWDNSTNNWDDWTLEVIQESADPTYPIGAELVDGADLMTSSDYLVFMFEERTTAIHIEMIGGRANTAAAKPTIYYHNGKDWVTVGNVLDTTATRETDFISLSQTGTWSWNAPAESDESPRFMFGQTGYVYKVQFDADLAGSGDAPEVVIDLVTGIPAQYTIPPVAFTSKYKNQLLLVGHNQSNEGNRVDFSMPGHTDVWNGELSSMNGIQSLRFGESEALVAGMQIYNKYGSRLVTGWFGLKATSSYMLTGDSPEDYVIYPVNETLGCAAPLTLVSADAAYTIEQNINRHVLIWLSYAGPAMFDGSTIILIKGIENYFDPVKSEYIKTSIIDRARAAYDPRTNCYHLLFPSGSSATDINKWLVYDLTRQKWYEIVPTTYPQSIWYVADTNGIGYLYGGLDTGYMMRLDNGTTWDGSAIVVEVETGDFLPIDIWHTTLIRKIKVFATKISEDVDMSVYHYGNTAPDDATVDLTFPLDSGSNRITWTSGRLGSNSDELGLFKRLKFTASFSSTSDWSLMGYGIGFQDYGIRD